MTAIYLKEIRSFLGSVIGYLAIGVYLTVSGLLVWIFPSSSVFEYGYADLSVFFNFSPYIFMFLIPAITMRTFSEEIKSGTLETLITRPIPSISIVLGKYLSALSLLIIALIPTLLNVIIVHHFSLPVGNVDFPGILGSYIGLILLGMAFTGIGILSSLLSDNQIVAFLIATILSFILYYGLGALAEINPWDKGAFWLEFFSLSYHYFALSKGVLSLENMFYMVAIAALSIFTANLILETKKG